MNNNEKRWTEEEKQKLLEQAEHWGRTVDKINAQTLNEKFNRELKTETWNRLILRFRKERDKERNHDTLIKNIKAQMEDMEARNKASEEDMTRIASQMPEYIQGEPVDCEFESPQCSNCKFWKFEYHCVDKDYDLLSTVGTCRIRSGDGDDFPERYDDDWCGEHVVLHDDGKE